MYKSIKFIFNYFLAPVLFILLCWSLYRQLIVQQDLSEKWQIIIESWRQPLFFLVFIMMFFNWGVESMKWKISMHSIEKLSFSIAFKSVLSGCSITLLTPNRVGEYGGRILYLKDENRISGISIAIIGSISQLIITLLMGIVSLVLMRHDLYDYILQHHASLSWMLGSLLFYGCVLITAVLLLIYFRLGDVFSLLDRIRFLHKSIQPLRYIHIVDRKLLLRILFYSFLRYILFTLQYIIMLHVMDVNIPFTACFGLVAIFYLVMAVAPTFGFFELPVRAVASVQVFGILSANTVGIQATALAIWLVNLVIPALIGSLMIFGLRILKDKQ